jgi:hypothetical protein
MLGLAAASPFVNRAVTKKNRIEPMQAHQIIDAPSAVMARGPIDPLNVSIQLPVPISITVLVRYSTIAPHSLWIVCGKQY